MPTDTRYAGVPGGQTPTPSPRKPWLSHPTETSIPGTPTHFLKPHHSLRGSYCHPELPRWAWAPVSLSAPHPAQPGRRTLDPSVSCAPSQHLLRHPWVHPTHQPPGSPPHQGWAYLSDTAGVVLNLGGGPEQAGGRGGRPQLQDPAEVCGVGGGAAGSRGRRRMRFLALGGQAELLGSPGEGRRGGRWGTRRCPGRLPRPKSAPQPGGAPGLGLPCPGPARPGNRRPSPHPALMRPLPPEFRLPWVPNPAAAVGWGAGRSVLGSATHKPRDPGTVA